jgi:ParB family chromosome partitioning protein
MQRLDLSGLETFKASALLEDATGKPLELALDTIDFDPKQPRRHILAETLTELAETIKTDGVLQPICVRPHPHQKGRYLINHGERRVRAARLAGLATIPGYIREDVDPYAQAIENVQRDDLLPLDLAAFVIEREQAGDARADIARRLGKPPSMITELAELAEAPALIRKVHDEGRCRDVRALYLLVRTHREQAHAVEGLLAGNAVVTRQQVETLAAEQGVVRAKPPASHGPRNRTSSASGIGNPLLVKVDGQFAIFDVSSRPSKTTGQVRFADGTQQSVELARLRLISWTENS